MAKYFDGHNDPPVYDQWHQLQLLEQTTMALRKFLQSEINADKSPH